ncbi:MAG: alpha-mannosidase [Paenibacillus sp.]|jgi:hypothetical protein|nr:alpha-mannosidase [Paenibacillus sp.]
MFFTESKLEARLRELSETRYRDAVPLERFSAAEDDQLQFVQHHSTENRDSFIQQPHVSLYDDGFR